MTTHAPTQWDAFLRSIVETPDDAAVRLIAADWLDENAGETACGRCGGHGGHIVPKGAEFRTPANGMSREDFLAGGGEDWRRETSTHWEQCDVCRGTGRVSDGKAARAEFIRCQVALAAMPAVCPDCGRGGAGTTLDIVCYRCEEEDARRRREKELLATMLPNGLSRRTLARYLWADLPRPFGEPGSGTAWEFRRGFVESVTLPAAAFCGGPCGECCGQGATQDETHAPGEFDTCPDCRGLGRTPGLAAELGRRVPLTGVVLSDKRPVKSESVEDYRWAKFTNNRAASDCYMLPADLFDRLLPDVNCVKVHDGPIMSVRAYGTEADALSALSRAAVRLARGRAGLPELATA